MYFEKKNVATAIDKTVYKSDNHYGDSNYCETKERANSNLIPKIICIVFCIISFLGGINDCTNKDRKILTSINESSYLYSYSEYHRMAHISIVANEKAYNITYLQITEETTREVKLNVFKEIMHIFPNTNYPNIMELLRLIIDLYNLQWNVRRRKRNFGK